MPPTLMTAIIALLETVGPMSMSDLALRLDRGRGTVYGSLRVLKERKVLHIKRYAPQPGVAGRHAPVYALGDMPDAIEKPAASRRVVNKKYRERHREKLHMQSRARRRAAGMVPRAASINPYLVLTR